MLNLALSAITVLLLLTSVKAQTVRLVGGLSSQVGRLEVYYNGTWGTVCDDGFTGAAARVVCYMLGYGHDGQVIGNRYGAGSGTIWLDNVQCRGTETSIADCRHRSWGSHDCGHSEDVSVSCVTARLVGGTSPQEGHLEIRYNGTRRGVCRNNFDNKEARVVCSMLGYGYVGHVSGNRYSAGYRTAWYMYYVRCSGT